MEKKCLETPECGQITCDSSTKAAIISTTTATFLSFPHCAHMRFLAHLCVVLLKRAVCIYISSDVYAYLREEKEGEEESHMSAVFSHKVGYHADS